MAFQREIKDLMAMDINPSLQILGWYVKGIRQKSTKRVNSFVACSAFLFGAITTVTPGTPRNNGVYTCQSP